jgi:hypothetical protein
MSQRSAGLAPALPLTPEQVERLTELRLLHGFAASLLFLWRAQSDPAVVVRFVGWATPGLPKAVREELRREVALVRAEGPPIWTCAAMLQAATHWYAGLRLPQTRMELWSGPPVCERRRLPTPVDD